MRFFLKVFYFVFSIFITAPLNGQNIYGYVKQDTLLTKEMGEVVITATRYPTHQLNIPEAIRRLDSYTISKYQARTSAEALNITPGVFVQKTNHGGGSPFIRGLTGNQTLLLIDGIRLSNAISRYGPNQTFNTIDLFGTERTEVLRGNGSVQYGSDALGGTVQAFTYQPLLADDPAWGGRIISRFASRGMEQSLHSALNHSNRNYAFRVSATARNFGDIYGGDTTGKQSPTGYQELDYDIKAKLLLSKYSTLTIAYQNVNQTDIPVYHKYVLENYSVNKMDPQKRDLGYIRMNQKFNGAVLKSAVFTASIHNGVEGRELQKSGSTTLRKEKDKIRSLGLSAEAVTLLSDIWSANSGFEFYNDAVNSIRTDEDIVTGLSTEKRGLYPDGSSMTSIAFFSLHSFEFGKWGLTAGARFNSFNIYVEDDAIGNARLTPSSVVANFAVMRNISDRSNIFASFNTGFRAPNIDDLGSLGIVDFRYEIPNYNLKPERSYQYQVGYKLIGDQIRGEAYLYRNHLSDLIVRNKVEGDSIDGYQVYIKENVENAYIQGFETSWDIEINRSWSFSSAFTYTYGQNITKNEPVRRIPPAFWRMSVEYNLKIWWLNFEWLGAGKQNRLSSGDESDNRIPAGGTPGWNILNINSGIDSGIFCLDLSLCNLFNTDYRYHGSGVNGAGRSMLLTLVFNIGNLKKTQ